MAEMIVPDIKSKRLFYLALSTVTLLFLGLIYAFSMFAAPMCQTFGLEETDVALTFNIMMIAFCIGCLLGSCVEKALGTRETLLCAGALFLVGFAGTGLFGHGQLFVVYLLYGVCGGIGVGMGYNTIVATTNVWFPDKVGFSSGVLMMGFGVSALILGNLSLSFISVMGLTATFIMLGVLAFSATVACAFLLRRPPENIEELMVGYVIAAGASADDPADDDRPLETPTFYVYWAWAIIISIVGLATIGTCAADAQLVGLDTAFSTMLVGFVSASNGLARIIMGIVYDNTNTKFTMTLNTVIAILATGLICAAFSTGWNVLYIVGALLCGFCYGASPVVASAFSRQRFGQKNYSRNLSITNFSLVFGSLLNIVIGAAVGITNRLEVFMVLLFLAVVALADVLLFSRMWSKDMVSLEERRAVETAQAL